MLSALAAPALAAPAPLTPAAAETVKARLDDVCPPDTTPEPAAPSHQPHPPTVNITWKLWCSKEVRGHTAPIEKDENGKIVL